jgi:hypothetical protein
MTRDDSGEFGDGRPFSVINLSTFSHLDVMPGFQNGAMWHESVLLDSPSSASGAGGAAPEGVSHGLPPKILAGAGPLAIFLRKHALQAVFQPIIKLDGGSLMRMRR